MGGEVIYICRCTGLSHLQNREGGPVLHSLRTHIIMWLFLLSTWRVTKAQVALTRPALVHPSAIAQTGFPGLNIYKLGTKQAHVVSNLQTSSGLWGHRGEQGARAQPVTEYTGKSTLYPGGSSPHGPQALCISTFIPEARYVHPQVQRL